MKMEDTLSEGDIELINCDTCGRHFRPEVHKKHEPICIKNSKKKRKIFSSGKQRAEGSDIPITKILKPGEIPKPDPKLALAEAKTKQWREKHNLLVESFRSARDYAKAKRCGAPLPPPPPALIDTSLIQCPFCQRRFNEESSKRHIAFCKEHQTKIAPKLSNQTIRKPIVKSPVSKVAPESSIQKIVVPSSNGSRAKVLPQPIQRVHSGSDDSTSTKPIKSHVSVPSRTVSHRTQPAPSLATVSQPRPTVSTRSITSSTKPSSLPRGPIAIKKPSITPVGKIAANKPSETVGGFCHECGTAYVAACAKFCSECGVRRLAI